MRFVFLLGGDFYTVCYSELYPSKDTRLMLLSVFKFETKGTQNLDYKSRKHFNFCCYFFIHVLRSVRVNDKPFMAMAFTSITFPFHNVHYNQTVLLFLLFSEKSSSRVALSKTF